MARIAKRKRKYDKRTREGRLNLAELILSNIASDVVRAALDLQEQIDRVRVLLTPSLTKGKSRGKTK